jgi:putative ABC transport system permease protein
MTIAESNAVAKPLGTAGGGASAGRGAAGAVSNTSLRTEFALALRQLRREFRLSEYLVLIFALILSVAAVTSVGFFANRVERAMAAQAATLLAADAVVSSPSVIGEDVRDKADSLQLASSEVIEFPSVVLNEDGDTALVAVKATGRGYPLRGEVRLSEVLYGADRAAQSVPAAGEVWVDPRVAGTLQIDTGSTLFLGDLEVTVAGFIAFEPDRSGGVFQMAPRVMMSLEDLPDSGLLGQGSRARYRLLMAGDGAAVEQFGDWIDTNDDANLRYRTVEDGSPAVRSALVNARRFLGLAAAVAVLLSGAAVALAARQIAERDMDTGALMRAFGANSRSVIRIVLIRLALLALIAAVLGSIIGFIAQQALAGLLTQFFQTELPPPTLAPLIGGISCAALALAGFCLPVISRAATAPVIRVLRRDLPLAQPSIWVVVVSALVAMLLLLTWLTHDVRLGALLIAGVVAVVFILWLIARGLVALSTRVKAPSLRRALEGLRRRPGSISLQIAAFSVGLLALLLLAIVRTDVLNTWQRQIPADAPNFFMINIQPQDVPAMADFLAERNIDNDALYPMIRGRLESINNKNVGEDGYESERMRRMTERDFNLTYQAEVNASNKVTAGEWWPEDTTETLFSVEEEFAEETGIALGDTLQFKIADRTVSGKVTSLREVEWESFSPNFFVVGTPAGFDDLPASFVTSMQVGDDQGNFVRDVVQQFPSVTVIEIGKMIERVTGILDRAALAVQYVFVFTLLAGVLVLVAAVLATRRERFHEAAILRTLGASRRYLSASMSREFILIGLLAGLMGSTIAAVVAYAMIELVMDLDYRFNPVIWALGVVLGVVAIWIAGVIASRPVLRQSPLAVIRSQV